MDGSTWTAGDYNLKPKEIPTIYRKKRSFDRPSRAEYMVKPVERTIDDMLPGNARDIMREVQSFEDETLNLGFNEALDNIDGAGKSHYYVELFIVADYSTFER